MPSDDPSQPPAAPARTSRGVRAFLRRMRKRLVAGGGEAARPPEPPTQSGEVDLVDQAEAFQTLRVADVMTPRADIVAVELSTPFEALMAQFVEAGHSRMPIYRETLKSLTPAEIERWKRGDLWLYRAKGSTQIQKLTDKYVKDIDELVAVKEKDIMTI